MDKAPLIVDIETSGTPFEEGSLLTLGWMEVGEKRAHIAPGNHLPPRVLEMMADPERPFISHTKYDARFLRLMGCDVTGPFYDTQVMAWVLNENQSLSLDSLAWRYTKTQMDKRLRVRKGEVFFETDDGDVVPIEDAPKEQLWAYNARDVEATELLFRTLWERLADSDWLPYYLRAEVPFTAVLLDMEVAGLPIDLPRSERLREELEQLHIVMERELHEAASLPQSFNLNSGPQLSLYLFSKKTFEMTDDLDLGVEACECLKSCLAGEHEDCTPASYTEPADAELAYDEHVVDLLPVGFSIDSVGRSIVHGRWTLRARGLRPGARTPDGSRPSTSAKALRANLSVMTDDWVKRFLEYRRVDKALTTYLRKYPQVAVKGRIYGRFNQTGTKTGRLSSSEPNLQNQPSHGDLGARMRDVWRPAPGRRLVVADASQLEPRLMAHFSQDPAMMAVYAPGGSGDIYVDIAVGVFGESNSERRGISKVLVLGMGYGAHEKRIGEILTINGYPTDPETGGEYLRLVMGRYHVFFDWREQVIARVHNTGYVRTIGGRRRRLKAQFADRSNWKNVGYGERQAVNAIIQGSAGDIMREDMVAQGGAFPELVMLAQVHDELVNEVDEGWDRVDEYGAFLSTAHGYDLRVPLLFEPHVGESWYEGKEGSPLELPEDMTDETEDFEEER